MKQPYLSFAYFAASALILFYLTIGRSSIESLDQKVKDPLYNLYSEAYFQGQKDALSGKIKIQNSTDSTYHWIGSPYVDSIAVSHASNYKLNK